MRLCWGLVIASLGCGDPHVTADAATDSAACPGHSVFHGVVRAFSPGVAFADWPRISGVRVCDDARPQVPCATSDADGAYTIECVPEGQVELSFVHEGHVRTIWLAVAAGTDASLDATLLTEAQNADFYAPVSATFPRPGYGVIGMNEVTHQSGIAFSATGAMGPYYSADGVTLDTTATGTVGDGLAFFIAPVGLLTIEITPVVPEQICGHALGAFLSTGHGLTVPVSENTESDVYVACR